MMNFVLASVPFVMKMVMVIWVLSAVILILIVLIQKGKGGGLGSAFGGVGSSLLGTKTGDFLTWVTISLVAVWLLLSIAAAKWFKPQASEYLQSDSPVASMPASTDSTQTQQTETQTPEANAPAVQ